jgi:hypothetical protein
MRLVDLPKYGPVHRFADYHVYRVLSVLSDRKRRGRKHLADLVGVGEGSMRTILSWMRDNGLVGVKQTGVRITNTGLGFFSRLPLQVKDIESSDISVSNCNVAVLVRGRGEEVGSGIEQRDAAIKAGADGATTIVVKGGRLVVPTDYELDTEDPGLASSMRGLFELKDGDVIVVGSAATRKIAEDGALAAALELV